MTIIKVYLILLLLIITKIPILKYIFPKVNFNLLLKFIRWIITKNI